MWCRFGGWDGKKWLSDVFVLDTSNLCFLSRNFCCFYINLELLNPDTWLLLAQFHLSGRSYQFQGQYLPQDVAILLQWLRSGYLSMVVEVISAPLTDNSSRKMYLLLILYCCLSRLFFSFLPDSVKCYCRSKTLCNKMFLDLQSEMDPMSLPSFDSLILPFECRATRIKFGIFVVPRVVYSLCSCLIILN